MTATALPNDKQYRALRACGVHALVKKPLTAGQFRCMAGLVWD